MKNYSAEVFKSTKGVRANVKVRRLRHCYFNCSQIKIFGLSVICKFNETEKINLIYFIALGDMEIPRGKSAWERTHGTGGMIPVSPHGEFAPTEFAPMTHPKLSISSSPVTFNGSKNEKQTCFVWFCFIVRTMLTFFLGKRKINFEYLIACWVDVGANSHGAKPAATHGSHFVR